MKPMYEDKRLDKILRLPYEGENPKIKQLIESIDDFVLGVERLHWVAVPEQQRSITPENVSQSYNSIKFAPARAFSPDCSDLPENHMGTFFKDRLKDLTPNQVVDVTTQLFISSAKLAQAAMNNLNTVITAEKLENQLSACKEELERNRVLVIELQKTVIDIQREQLNSVETSVQKVKAYSTVMAQNYAAATASPVAKKASREKNLVIFGLPETTENADRANLEELFDELKEKPKVANMKRIGERNENRPRPLLVSLEKRATLLELLKKARQLKESNKHSTVYLSPDLNPSQLKERKALLATLKRVRTDDPGGNYYIKNNVIQVTAEALSLSAL
eukprot:sb/3466586/